MTSVGSDAGRQGGIGVSLHPGQEGKARATTQEAEPAHPCVPVPSVQGADSTHRGTPKLGQTLGLSVSAEYTADLDGSCHTVCSLDMLGYFSS